MDGRGWGDDLNEYMDENRDVCGAAALFRAASCGLLPQGGVGGQPSARRAGGDCAAGAAYL